MRHDLNKLLCERERVGSRHRRFKDVRRTTQRIKLDADNEANMPKFQGILRTHREGRGDTKNFNENLRPLYGAIRKAVGRKWDDFYSDLCKVFDMRSVINQHILLHLEQYCERELQVIDGELWTKPEAYRHGILKLKECVFIEFYVDPRDGIIKRNNALKTSRQINREYIARQRAKDFSIRRVIDKDTELHKIKDVWFVLTFADIPKGYWKSVPDGDRSYTSVYYGEQVRDAQTGAIAYYQEPSRFRGIETPYKNRYCKSKRSASHELLKKHGVI